MKQRTIQKTATLQGKGLHSGQETTIVMQAAAANTGIQFRRIDLAGQPIVRADVQYVSQTQRSTTIAHGAAVVTTIEHLMAACLGLGIDNLLVDIDGGEVPILDGSAMPFVRALQSAELVEQEQERVIFKIEQPITVSYEGSEITILPADTLEMTALIDFNSKILGQQFAQLRGLENFEAQIAPARTFVFLHEIQPLLNAGLIKGGDIDNAVVFVENIPSDEELHQLAEQIGKPYMRVQREGILNLTALHFSNEPARHKLLDLLGDLSLSGVHICGRVIAHKPGHTINALAAKAIKQAYKDYCKSLEIPKYDPMKKPVFDINDITSKLQHRFPFLLIDKIVELSDNHIVGVKNVTMNEPFFVGHFPNNPVMPGVLQIEAMAQTGGLFVFNLNKVENPLEWDTYFLRINNARFRDKVVPGDTLLFRLELMSPVRRGLCEMRAKAFVGDRIVAEAELLAQIIRRK
jgi:UDP-3-O-[3-hydroxymyristoyl] N-acetylglucosamine deacetylase / 3-hydroxyacyl-[acyl-carrier-protein] dehydratase